MALPIPVDPFIAGLVLDGLRAIGREVDARIARDEAAKRADPCGAAVFHDTYRRTLPRWRWLARWRHRLAANHWASWCTASERQRCASDSQHAARIIRAARRPTPP